MRFFVVRKDSNGKFNILEETYELSSARYQYVRKNFQMFDTIQGAQNYILEHTSPEERQRILDEMNQENLEKMKDEYMKIKEKKDMEKLFGCMLSDYGYEKIKSFIDYLMRGE